MLKNLITTTRIAAAAAAGFILVTATDGAFARDHRAGSGTGLAIQKSVRFLGPPIGKHSDHRHKHFRFRHYPVYTSAWPTYDYYGFACMPGTWYVGIDGRKHICQ